MLQARWENRHSGKSLTLSGISGNDGFTPTFPEVSENEGHETAISRSFSYAAPAVWNAVPYEIKSSITVSSFKTSLKTNFFRQSY